MTAPVVQVPVDMSAYNNWVGSTVLRHVEWHKLAGERLIEGLAPRTNYRTATAYARADGDADVVAFRFDVTAELMSESGEDVLARIDVVYAVHYDVPDLKSVSDADLMFFGSTSAALVATPYLREAIFSMAQKLGQQGVLLPGVFAPATAG